MTSVKDTASFFVNGSSNQFDFVLGLYTQVLKLKAENKCKKPEDLIRLDEWYQNQLPALIKKRGKDAHIIHDELVQCMKWKQTRGKFYPQLSYLIKVNTPRAVMAETKKAFKKMPNLEQAITALSNLKGVGTTMASALLAAAAPETAPFMADECLMAIPEIEGIDYTTREYMNFVQHIQATTDRLNEEVHGPAGRSKKGAGDDDDSSSSNSNGDTPKIAKKWSPHNVELALWTHYVARELQPDLLDNMPAAVEGSKNSYTRNPTTTNGSGNNNVTPAATTTTTTTTTAEEPPSDESNLDTELGKSGSGATSDESNSKDAIVGTVANNKYIDSLDDECTKSEEDSLEKPTTTTTTTVPSAVASIRNNNSDEVTADSDSQSSAAKRSTPFDDDDDEEDDDEDEEDEEDGSSGDGGGAPDAKKPKLD